VNDPTRLATNAAFVPGSVFRYTGSIGSAIYSTTTIHRDDVIAVICQGDTFTVIGLIIADDMCPYACVMSDTSTDGMTFGWFPAWGNEGNLEVMCRG
jgi:hypothetical protein